MRKATKIGFIGVFCAVIGLAFPIFNIFSKQLFTEFLCPFRRSVH